MENSSLEDQLVYEVWRRNISAIDRLLSAGADPNLPGRTWSSAIACAGENDETGEIAKLLVNAGANVNLQDAFGVTPLHRAVDVAIDGAIQANRDSIDWTAVDVFLSIGADPRICDGQNETIFDVVAAYGSTAVASFNNFMNTR